MEDAPKVCPHCLQDVTNGIGPDDLPEVTKLLNNLPSSHIFRLAADWHDFGYHIGYKEDHRQMIDETYLQHMIFSINKSFSWYLRGWYRLQAYRNYWCVRQFGSKFFNYDGCPKKLK